MVFAQSNNAVSRQARRFPKAFTLVELLVVIGIIALLIAILLPSLSVARQAAQRSACGAKIQQMLEAANIHAVDHKGYWPLAGFLVGEGSYMAPSAVNDSYTSHYTYMGFQDIASSQNNDARVLAPITLALGSEMGFRKNLATYDNSLPSDPAGVDSAGLARHFLCPSQLTSDPDLRQVGWLYAGDFNSTYGGGCTDQVSYVFNEGVLGYNDYFGRLRGLVTSVRQPSKTFFVADGLAGKIGSRYSGTWKSFSKTPPQFPPPWPTYTIWNGQPFGPVTLADCILQTKKAGVKLAGDTQSFDLLRHHMKMNIGFCDGHVETRDIPNITKDPTAKGLLDVYVLAQ